MSSKKTLTNYLTQSNKICSIYELATKELCSKFTKPIENKMY